MLSTLLPDHLKYSLCLTALDTLSHALPFYTRMIRPILDYADILYICTLSIGRTFEGIQKRVALIYTGSYEHSEYVKLLHKLVWANLKLKHNYHILCTNYRIIKVLEPRVTYVTSLLPYPVANLTKYNLCTHSNLCIPRMLLKSSKKSFIRVCHKPLE